MASQQDEDSRRLPARVYPAVQDASGWIVEAPPSEAPASGELRTFTGVAALAHALEYAHRIYGSASYFSR